MRIRSLVTTVAAVMALSVPVFAQSTTQPLGAEQSGFGHTLSGGTKVSWDQVPAAVKKAVQKRAGNIQVEDVDKGTVDGKTVYEIAYKAEGQHNEIRVTEQGAVLKVMEGGQISNAFLYPLLNDKNISWNDIPAPVQKTILTQAGNAKVQLVRKGTLHGQTVYEAAFPSAATHNRYVRVAEDGKMVARAEGGGTGAAHPAASTPNARAITATTAPATSGKVPWTQLPAAAQATIRQYAGAAQIEDIDRDTTHGPVTYEASFKRNGVQNELKVGEDGRVVQWMENGKIKEPSGAAAPNVAPGQVYSEGEGKVKFEELPEAAKKTIQQYAAGATIEDIDRTTKNGETSFEAAFKKDGKHNEVKVKADGSVVQRMENGVKVQ